MRSNGGAYSGLVEADHERGTFRVRRDAYRSPEVFAKELEVLFGRCWLYLGHESELVKNGDFVTRRVAGRDMIFNRDRKGAVHAFFNSCTHRGATVCRERHGSARNFTCPYHGWVFSSEGTLVDQGIKGGYSPQFNCDGRYDLMQAPRLEHYRGFYFVNFNARAIGLAEYLAGAREIIDLIADQTEAGQQIVSGAHEYVIHANYKYLAENSIDAYHAVSVHSTYFDFLTERLRASGDEAAVAKLMGDYPAGGRGSGLGNGHGMFEGFVPTGRPVASWIPPWGPDAKREIERIRARLTERFGVQTAMRIAETQKNMVIFPNLVLNDHVAITVRSFQPETHNRMRVTAWAMGPKDEIPQLRSIRLDNFLTFLGPAGFATPDDNEMLELCQNGAAHSPANWTDISRGMCTAREDDMRVGSGPWTDEAQLRAYWTQWDRIMGGAETLEG